MKNAYLAWMQCSELRQNRQRNKRFVFGDQWADQCTDLAGNTITERQKLTQACQTPLTNNLLRQVVRTVVGRFRAQVINAEQIRANSLLQVIQANHLNELDSRALEEFLISGACVQRVEPLADVPGGVRVDNVNLNHFFIDSATDPRGDDSTIVGMLHDLTLPQIMRRVAQGNRRKAQWVQRLYSTQIEERVNDFASSIGAGSVRGYDFWHAPAGRYRAIEVWTLESQEVLTCHDKRRGTLTNIPFSDTSAVKHAKNDPNITSRYDIVHQWHCRWYSPMGDLLCHFISPWPGGRHPFITKFYPLIDGEVHSFVEGAIDQQKHVNRMITLADQIMTVSAKGVLLFPATALPDGFTWRDVRRAWSSPTGILPYDPREHSAKPEQMITQKGNSDAYNMISLQMKLLEQVSGVSGALQGKSEAAGLQSASLYDAQAQNANLALTDIYDTFNTFRHMRNRKILTLLGDGSIAERPAADNPSPAAESVPQTPQDPASRDDGSTAPAEALR